MNGTTANTFKAQDIRRTLIEFLTGEPHER